MAILTVGLSGQYGTIAEAVNAAASGDEIDVSADHVYTNDFFTIRTSLTLQAVGGEVQILATGQPSNGKAAIVAGSPGATIAINGFDISGVTVPDSNGAAIRYEGGTLNLSNDYFHNNQEGLLGYNDDPNGIINVTHSEFAYNGDGSGSTHNFYAGHMASVTIDDSYFHDAVVGHEIKSRAQSLMVTNSRVFDNNGSASYSIDMPNGGSANISGNVIEQGPNTQNPAIFAWGEEGVTNSGSASISGNTLVNDDPGGYGTLNPTTAPLAFTNNQLWNLSNLGNVVASGNVNLASRPSLDTSSLSFITGSQPPPPPPPPLPDPVTITGTAGNDTINVAQIVTTGPATPTFIYGLAGNDTINATGMTGAMSATGGAGADKMTGGSGQNSYLFAAVGDSTPFSMDVVTNFHAADVLDFRGLGSVLAYDGNIPAAHGNGKKSVQPTVAAHSVVWQQSAGNTFVYVNTSGSSERLTSADMKVELLGSVSLTSSNIMHL